jgi:hypothetical protein
MDAGEVSGAAHAAGITAQATRGGDLARAEYTPAKTRGRRCQTAVRMGQFIRTVYRVLQRFWRRGLHWRGQTTVVRNAPRAVAWTPCCGRVSRQILHRCAWVLRKWRQTFSLTPVRTRSILTWDRRAASHGPEIQRIGRCAPARLRACAPARDERDERQDAGIQPQCTLPLPGAATGCPSPSHSLPSHSSRPHSSGPDRPPPPPPQPHPHRPAGNAGLRRFR